MIDDHTERTLLEMEKWYKRSLDRERDEAIKSFKRMLLVIGAGVMVFIVSVWITS